MLVGESRACQAARSPDPGTENAPIGGGAGEPRRPNRRGRLPANPRARRANGMIPNQVNQKEMDSKRKPSNKKGGSVVLKKEDAPPALGRSSPGLPILDRGR